MWTETTKSLPDLGLDVLVYSEECDILAIASLVEGEDGFWWESDSDAIAASAVSHWMPLPPRPASVD